MIEGPVQKNYTIIGLALLAVVAALFLYMRVAPSADEHQSPPAFTYSGPASG